MELHVCFRVPFRTNELGFSDGHTTNVWIARRHRDVRSLIWAHDPHGHVNCGLDSRKLLHLYVV